LPGDDARIDVALPADIPHIEVDPVQVERTLVNLLENALRFSPVSGRVDLAVEAEAGEARFVVSDRGPGIAPGELERIFEPFVQAGEGGRSGSGLGLAIARGFTEINGGRVWVESAPGGGARFSVAFPLAEAPARSFTPHA
jgi:two-component system sensor histidine kinase KdpD